MMGFDYVRCVVAGVLSERRLPSLEVDFWLDGAGLEETPELRAARQVVLSSFQPREERPAVIGLSTGNTGVGKTVAAIAALGDGLVEAHRRREAGALILDRPERPGRTAGITPEVVRSRLGMDWLSYQSQEKLLPGLLSRELKTQLEADSGWDYHAAPLTFAFWDARRMARANPWTDAFREAVDEATWADVTILDDLGAEATGPRSPWLPVVEEVVATRYSEGLPTLLTSNLRLPDFRALYGERLVDRARARGFVLENGGPSRRRTYNAKGSKR